MTGDKLLSAPVYGLSQAEKEPVLLNALNDLTDHHRQCCPEYGRLLRILRPQGGPAQRLADVPYLPVQLFKSHSLLSVPQKEVFKTLTSSGTTGQSPSIIYVDRVTARLQTQALVQIMSSVLGPRRLPMLIVDTVNLLRDRRSFSARGAGVMGMMNFGSKTEFVLDEDMKLIPEKLRQFLSLHGQSRFVIFGFTFMVWKYFVQSIRDLGLDLSNATLIHSGGWKKLEEEAVSNSSFKATLEQTCGIKQIYNFYGMVEQVGSVFLEGDDGFLYPPAFADIIIRDPETWEEVQPGQTGVIQVLSTLPFSYPGHSLLSEDLGTLQHVDQGACGRKGKAFTVTGRVPLAELRGCSDTHAYDQSRPNDHR